MKKIKFIICVMVVLSFITMATSCWNKGLSDSEKNQVLQSIRSKLPMQLIEDEMVITDVEFDEDQLSYTILVSPEYFEYVGSNKELNSDENVAQVIQLIGDNDVKVLIDNHLGLKYNYIKRDARSVKRVIDISPERLEEIWDKMQSGDVEATSFIEQIEDEFEDMDLPVEMAEGLLLTKAYVDGNKVCYVFKFEEIEDMDTDSEEFQEIYDEMKEEMTTGLRGESIFQISKRQILSEDIRFVFTYTNKYGKTLFTIKLKPEDIFPGE